MTGAIVVYFSAICSLSVGANLAPDKGCGVHFRKGTKRINTPWEIGADRDSFKYFEQARHAPLF